MRSPDKLTDFNILDDLKTILGGDLVVGVVGYKMPAKRFSKWGNQTRTGIERHRFLLNDHPTASYSAILVFVVLAIVVGPPFGGDY